MSIFYLIFIGLALYFCIRYDGIEEYDQHKEHRLWLMCGYLICLSGFSYGLGADKFAYMQEFEMYPDTFSEVGNFIWIQFMTGGQMPLWTILNLAAKAVFHSFYAVQFIQSAAINIAVCFIVSKYTHRYFLFLLVYFFTLQFFVFNTEIMREGIALSFMLYGMHYWMNGRKWVFFVMLPLGLMFHISAIIAILFPFAFFKVNWKTLGIAFLAAFLMWLLSDIVLGHVMVSVLGGMGAIVEKILIYSIQASTIFGFLRSAITNLVFPFIIMYSVLQLEQDEELYRRKEKMIAFMMILAVFASAFAGFTRLYNYSRVFYLVMLADFIYMLFQYKEHLIMRVGVLAGTALLILSQYLISYQSTNTYYYNFFFPYTCILDEDRSVYFREIAHGEATEAEQKDNNVRDIQ